MLKRLRVALVKSFVGAIALGWIFSQGIFHFAFIFATPVASWLQRRQYGGLIGRNGISTSFSVAEALPEVIKAVVLLLVGYILIRWLSFKPLEDEATEARSEVR
jgi:ABC-type spermidine/putrescine transport system permease subunit II